MKILSRSVVILVILIVNSSALIYSQSANLAAYQYISPLPGSSMILPENNIIIREGNLIDESTIHGENKIVVTGSKSGRHKGKLILSDDKRTLIFSPDEPYERGEEVIVKVYGGIFTLNKTELSSFEFSFSISPGISAKEYEKALETVMDLPNCKYGNVVSYNVQNSNDDLPEDFPEITMNVSNNPSPGFLFFAPFLLDPQLGYLIISDNSGTVIYYKRMPSVLNDFKCQSNGLLTFGDIRKNYFYAMDSSYALIDSFSTGNGYLTDTHEFQMIDNGHSLLMAYDWQQVRMDTVVAGGDSSAVVIGLIIQELDASKNVVFQWRSWDHFLITDATEDIDLTAHTIDYVHGNAIELDEDGNLLISSRHLDEITKIDRETGEIIWRWGGIKCRNNQFQFLNDLRTFSHQHDIRRIASGNLTLYDNGNLLEPRYSRALEYHLDEINKSAELIWEYSQNPPEYMSGRGNVQRLSNSNTIIGWGGWVSQDVKTLSEVRIDGSVALELSLPSNFTNYRAFRFPWKTNLFVTNPDSIFFESIPVGDSAVTTINLISNSSEEINITGFFNRCNFYIVEHTIPFILPPYGSKPIEIKFKPVEEGYFKDTLHIRSDTDTSRIAQIMVLAGRTDTSFSGINNQNIAAEYQLEQNYPNPFNPTTTIRFTIADLQFTTLKIYNVLGYEVATLVNEEKPAGTYKINFEAKELSSGVYFYKLQAGEYSDIKKLILLK